MEVDLAREGYGLTGVAVLAAEDAAVVARDRRRPLPERLGGRDRGAAGDGARGLVTHGDHDPGQ